MPHIYVPGNALQCIVNSHRHGWNGHVCNDAKNWDCGMKIEFRTSFCAQGEKRCHDLHIFNTVAPSFIVPERRVGWLLRDDPTALKDQIILLSAKPWSEPRGIRTSADRRYVSVGAYRVKDMKRIDFQNNNAVWELVPYEDGWTRFPYTGAPSPRFDEIPGGSYFVEVAQTAVLRHFADLAEAAESQLFSEEDRARFFNFSENLRNWFDAARVHAEKVAERAARRPVPGPAAPTGGFQKLAGIKNLAIEMNTKQSTVVEPQQLAGAPILPGEQHAAKAAPVAAVAPAPARHAGWLDQARLDRLRGEYGDEVVKAIQVGTATKSLLVFAGNPGVGKSRLAMNLLDEADPHRLERTLLVPVSSTWRGREDLLGYVNPVTNQFEPTEFTRFLIRAERAWKQGDTRTRIVVFEEFNLSQPEHWLSDILVIGEYEDEKHREIMLGGKEVRGEEPAGRTRVMLSPAVRFVATINTDHTTRSLSPRVLDRAAVIELALSATDALKKTHLEGILNEDQTEAISYIDDRLRPKGVTFSLRTAQSLKACLGLSEKLGLSTWDAIDFVLDQQMLVKVHLFAHDQGDRKLLEDLKSWFDDHAELWRSGQKVEGWERQLDADRDVNQA